MDLYNFFTEHVEEEDAEKMKNLQECFKDLADHGFNHFLLCPIKSPVNESRKFVILGTAYGADSNIGPVDILPHFESHDIKVLWFDAEYPYLNSLEDK